jgi:hypothetical protein
LETVPASETFVFYSYLEYLTVDKVQKPSDSEWYTPSSEPFTIYTSTCMGPFRNKTQFSGLASFIKSQYLSFSGDSTVSVKIRE